MSHGKIDAPATVTGELAEHSIETSVITGTFDCDEQIPPSHRPDHTTRLVNHQQFAKRSREEEVGNIVQADAGPHRF
jgi:hypothetical protein